MANIDNLPQVQACAIAVTDLDANGIITASADSRYVSSALTELQVNPVYRDATEIEEPNACDTICVNFKGDDSLKRVDVSLTICTFDPYLIAKLGGGDILTDAGVNGYAFPAIGPLTGNGVSIEVWSRRIDDGVQHDEYPWAWWVLPRVKNLRWGNQTFNNGSRLPVFTGQALENPNWFDGPDNDWPVASDRVVQWFPVAALPTIDNAPSAVAAS